MEDNRWTTNCILFGAELFNQLHHGRIKEEEAIDKIKNLSFALNDDEAKHLLEGLRAIGTFNALG
ncbi:hypothetical protein ES705_18395 [subsurface metagenome]